MAVTQSDSRVESHRQAQWATAYPGSFVGPLRQGLKSRDFSQQPLFPLNRFDGVIVLVCRCRYGRAQREQPLSKQAYRVVNFASALTDFPRLRLLCSIIHRLATVRRIGMRVVCDTKITFFW